jgi:hypothetical protein
MNNDLEQLMRSASYSSPDASSLEGVVGAAMDRSAQAAATKGDAGSIAVEVVRLLQVTQEATATNAAAIPAKTTSSAKSSSGDERGVADTILRTTEMMTGVGPIVAGLMSLFGSKDAEPLPALEKFSAPAPVSVEAGLSSTRELGSIRYAQGGRPEMEAPPSAAGSNGAPLQGSTPTINVNIQAMDSRSFLDRQDDIARAVREAMLHSNSLNDVVMEL